jgi:hypothetical protein
VKQLDATAIQRVRVVSASVREGWADFLCRYHWDVFATLTYRGHVWTDEKVVRDVRTWVFEWAVQAAIERGAVRVRELKRKDGSIWNRYAGTWWNAYTRKNERPVFVVGIEPHKSGALHAHAIIRWPVSYGVMQRTLGWKLWTRTDDGGLGFGWSRIEPPSDSVSVSHYVSKYVVKGGEVWISDSFLASQLSAA